MENLPLYISVLFAGTTVITVLFLFFALNKNKWVLIISVLIGTYDVLLAKSGVLFDFQAIPPRFLLLVAPSLFIVLMVLLNRRSKKLLLHANLKLLTLLHTIRVPVEIVLYWLALNALIPESMTFAGINFDILSGITAPIIYLVAFKGAKMKKGILFAWNVFTLMLLIIIVFTAILGAPSVIQMHAFEQPNIAIFYVPFTWLPGIVVPIVALTHFTSFKMLSSKHNN